MKIRVFISMVLCVAGVLGASAADVYKFVIVEEETHAPMAGVQVNVRAWCDGSEWAVPYDCVTDTNGICCVKKNNVRSLSVLVDDDATRYCSSLSGLKKAEPSSGLVVTVGVRRVVRPIPLVVKEQGHSFSDIFGAGNGVLQYDFFKGSYLPPAGTGVVADVTFRRMPIEELGFGSRSGDPGTLSMRHRETMVVEFAGEGDGVVRVPDSPQSDLRYRTAPTDGYVRTYKCMREDGLRMENIRSWDDDKTLCFRIRTRRNEKGELVEAYYGKIYGDIAFDFTDEVEIGSPRFLYYLNPNSMDTNLEYDGRHNLRPGARRSDYEP